MGDPEVVEAASAVDGGEDKKGGELKLVHEWEKTKKPSSSPYPGNQHRQRRQLRKRPGQEQRWK